MKHLVWIWLVPTLAWAVPPDPVNDNYALMLKWLDLESQKGRLQSEWNDREALLERRLQLLDAEREALQKVIAKGRDTTDEIDQRRQELLADQQSLEREQTLLEGQITAAIQQAELLQPQLPPPLQTEWAAKLATAMRDEATNSQKLERLLSMYKLLDEFNHRVALHKAPLRVSSAEDAPPVMVTQIYLGLSQGWYVSEMGDISGYGRPTPQGWQWWHGADTAELFGSEIDAEALLAARDMLTNPAAARFVTLPVTSKGESGGD